MKAVRANFAHFKLKNLFVHKLYQIIALTVVVASVFCLALS